MRPDGAGEPARTALRPLALHTLPGLNYWARRPVTRLDLAVGRFDEISTADVPGFTDALVAALPGLADHECSRGRPGGFLERLADGTYAPHVTEHVALELQRRAGDDVGFGRARGGARDGEYHVVIAHRHAGVGRAALREALALVAAAFDGEPLGAEVADVAVRAGRDAPDEPRPTAHVSVAVCGPADAAAALADALRGERRRLAPTGDPPRDDAPSGAPLASTVLSLTPGTIVERGLPYAACDLAVLLDDSAATLPEGFREPERAARLLTVLVDGLAPGGRLVCPARATAVRDYAAARGADVVAFSDAWAAGDADAGAALLALVRGLA